jgi:hypothetical protein
MTDDAMIGPGKRYAFPDLDMRLDVDFSGFISTSFRDMVIKNTVTAEEVPFRAYSINNHREGCKHLGFTIQHLSVPHCIDLGGSLQQIRETLSKVEIGTRYAIDPDSEVESTDELPWSNRVFIYTNSLKDDKPAVLSIFRNLGLRAILSDDERWKRMLAAKRPDVFLSHDSRDKDDLARPLAHAMSRLGLVAWYDEFSLKPGDRLSASIDKGLTECRHACLLITPNFLENKSWTSVEMSTLLTRAVGETNLIIPVWSKVDAKAVGERSARLADLVAIRIFSDIDSLAAMIFNSVRSAGP